MKKLFLIFSLLLILSVIDAQAQLSLRGISGVGVGGGVSAAADGPNAWYYGGGGDDDSYGSTEGNGGEINCNDITISVGGSLTKISRKYSDGGNAVKYVIYNTSGAILDNGCSVATITAGAWNECTLSTPYTIASGTYRICFMTSANQNGYYNANGGVCKWTSGVYANFPASYNPISLSNCGDTDKSYAIKVYVD